MKNRIKERAKSVPAEIKSSVSLSMATAKYINELLKKKGITQREFAVMLGKKESEISKWLTGAHNFTYNTIGKISNALGEPIIILPNEAPQNIYLVSPIKVGAEQSICIPAKGHGYTSVDVGKNRTFKKYTTITKSGTVSPDKFQIFEFNS